MANKIVTDGVTYGISPNQSYNRCVREWDADSNGAYFEFLQYDGGGRISIDEGTTNDTYVYRHTVENVNTYLGKHQLVKDGKFSPYEEHRLITENQLDNCFLNYDKSLQYAPEVFVPGTSFWKNVSNSTGVLHASDVITNQSVYESYARYGLSNSDMYCYMFYPKYPFDDVMNDWQTHVDYAYYDGTAIDGEFLDSSVNMAYAGYYNRSTSIVICPGTTHRVCSYKSNYFKCYPGYPGDPSSEWIDQTDIIYVCPAFITKIKIPCFWAGNDYSLVNYYSAYSNDVYSIFYIHFLKDRPANFNESTSSTYCALYESASINSVYIENFELKINGDWYSINGWYTCC